MYDLYHTVCMPYRTQCTVGNTLYCHCHMTKEKPVKRVSFYSNLVGYEAEISLIYCL